MLPPLRGECGAAFPLQTVARKSVSIEHPSGTVTIRAGAPLVDIALRDALPADQVRAEAWRALQEALDLYVTQTRNPLVTRSGDSEFVTWQKKTGAYHLCYVDTSDSGWSMSGTLTGGGPPATPPPPPVHHPALRFYRLSQASDDLFDAYRNAYLALECLISSESAKSSREPELEWLIRVAKSHFSIASPGGIDREKTLDEIYKRGRLPLFHAKQSATFYTPHGPEREHILRLLEDLSFLLAAFLRHKLGHHAVGGWGSMAQFVYDAQARTAFECDKLVLRSRWLKRALKPSVVVFDTPRQFGNLWAQITVEVPSWLSSVKSMETMVKGRKWTSFNLPEAFFMDANQPKAQSDVVVILSQKVGDLIRGLCGLTFELSGRQRQDARRGLRKCTPYLSPGLVACRWRSA